MNLVEWSEFARNITLLISAGFASYAAFYGEQSWKRQTKYTRKVGVTLELFRAAIWLQRAFALARPPMDGRNREEIDNHGFQEAKRKRASELWADFFPSVRRFEDAIIKAGIFRTDLLLEECGKEIRESVNEFQVAIHFEVMGLDTSDPDLKNELWLGRYDTGPDNPATMKMRNSVERLICYLGKNLRS